MPATKIHENAGYTYRTDNAIPSLVPYSCFTSEQLKHGCRKVVDFHFQRREPSSHSLFLSFSVSLVRVMADELRFGVVYRLAELEFRRGRSDIRCCSDTFAARLHCSDFVSMLSGLGLLFHQQLICISCTIR